MTFRKPPSCVTGYSPTWNGGLPRPRRNSAEPTVLHPQCTLVIADSAPQRRDAVPVEQHAVVAEVGPQLGRCGQELLLLDAGDLRLGIGL